MAKKKINPNRVAGKRQYDAYTRSAAALGLPEIGFSMFRAQRLTVAEVNDMITRNRAMAS